MRMIFLYIPIRHSICLARPILPDIHEGVESNVNTIEQRMFEHPQTPQEYLPKVSMNPNSREVYNERMLRLLQVMRFARFPLTSISFQQPSTHANHIDVKDLRDQLIDIRHQRFEIERCEQGNT